MKYVYNKLVRDKIPDNIDKIDGRKATYKILDDEDYLKELDKKLFEEAHEFIEEHSIEELGDLIEVVLAIMEFKNISMEEVEEVRKNKKDKNGGFENKIYLIDVEEKDEEELNN